MRVALMVTCVNDALFPETGRNVVRLLRRLGVNIEFPSAQTCCGQPLVNSGYFPEAVPLLRNFVAAFDGYDAVVAPSGSCVGSVRHQHNVVASRCGDQWLIDRVAGVSAKVYELSEFVVDVLGIVDVGAYFPHAVAYHPTCHSSRLLRVGDRPIRLLRAVQGLTLVTTPNADECCGFGGTFALKNSDVSVAIGTDKVDDFKRSGAEVVVSGDRSCLSHLGGLMSRRGEGPRLMHLADVLAASHGQP